MKRGSRWLSLSALVAVAFVVGLDMTVLNVALPSLSASLHASTTQLQWFVDSYNIILAALLLPAGMLGDRFGHKKILLGAMAVFCLGSLACAVAQTPSALIAARLILGVGAAGLIPLYIAFLPLLFAPEERRKALAIWAVATGLSFPLGPIIGGILLSHFWWGSVFLINVPVAVLAFVAAYILLPNPPIAGTKPQKIDWAGLIISSLGLIGITYASIEAGQLGWRSWRVLALLLSGTLLLLLCWAVERRKLNAFIDMRLFRTPAFVLGSTLTASLSLIMFGILFALPLYLHAVVHASALQTGFGVLPLVGGLVIGSTIAGKITKLRTNKQIVISGLILLTAALVVGAGTVGHLSYAGMTVWITGAGIGWGLVLPTVMGAALGALPPDKTGIGSGLILAIRQVGAGIGVAVLGSILNGAYRSRILSLGHDMGMSRTMLGELQSSVSHGVDTAYQQHSPATLHVVQQAFIDSFSLVLKICVVIGICCLVFVYMSQRQKS